MKKTIALLLAVISLNVMAQSAGNYVYEQMKGANVYRSNNPPPTRNIRALQSRNLTIEANALMSVIPDAQIAVFTMVQLGETAQEATELLDSKIKPIKAELNKLGIPSKDIVVDMVSFIPRYEDTVVKKRFSKTFTEIPKGFELKKNIHIKFRNHEHIDKIIAICATHEVFDLAKVEYVVLNNEENMNKMREKMLRHLGNKIAFYHDLEVQDKIEINMINETVHEFYPMDRYLQYSAHSSSSFEAVTGSRKKKNIKRVTKNTSMFYDPVNTKNYDIVINPGILEPTVQYSFKLTVAYTLPVKEKKKEEPKKEKVIEKQYILVTPNGDTKLLDYKTETREIAAQ